MSPSERPAPAQATGYVCGSLVLLRAALSPRRPPSPPPGTVPGPEPQRATEPPPPQARARRSRPVPRPGLRPGADPGPRPDADRLAGSGPEPGPDPRPLDDPRRLAALLRELDADPALRAALELASPHLIAAAGRHPATGGFPRAGDRRRAVLALSAYQLRRRHRATPFGLFAGTALITAAPTAAGGLGSRHRVLLRPAPAWLADLVAVLEADPELPRLAPGVRVSPGTDVHRLGPLHLRTDASAGGPGRWSVRGATIRGPLPDAVLALAAAGPAQGPLLDLLRTAVTGPTDDQLLRALAALRTTGLLATDLAPPPGAPDPLGHLTARLGGGHPHAEPLRRLGDALRQAGSPPAAERLRQLRSALAAAHPAQAGLVADTLLDTDLRLPTAVVREVERAASAAWACAPPRPDRTLAGLHRAFLDRYGLDRPVPLRELLDPASSLGLDARSPWAAPSGEASGAPPGTPPAAARDRLLTGLALDALALDAPDGGAGELPLDRPLLRRLAACSGTAGDPPPADVFAEVVTDSAGALDRGDFLVVLAQQAGSGPPGAVAGRLAALLGPSAAALPRHPGARGDEPPYAEVVLRPPDPAAAHLVTETGWAPYRIDLTERRLRGRSERDLGLDDLLLTASPERLRLHSRRLGREIRPVGYSALHPGRAGAVAGLLLAVGRAGASPWRAWDWGAAEALPRLPRVRLGRAVLASARWLVPPELLLLADGGSERRWRRALDRWRTEQALPPVVLAGSGDRRLPLELADPVHAELLRRELRGRRSAVVTEPPGGAAAWRAIGWPQGPDGPHAAQFVLPLHPRRAHRPAPVRTGPARSAAAATVPPRRIPPTATPPGAALPDATRPRAAAPDATPPQAALPDAHPPRATPPDATPPPATLPDATPPQAAPPRTGPESAAAGAREAWPDPAGDPDPVFPPGGPWLCAVLAAPAPLHDAVLAELADPAVAEAARRAEVDRWFFVRGVSASGVPELRLRWHGRPDALHGTLLPALHAWTERLRGAGLLREWSLAEYRPERWRYGGDGCTPAAERFFHQDSRLCLRLLADAAGHPAWTAAPGVLSVVAALLGPAAAAEALRRPRLPAAEREAAARLRRAGPTARRQPPGGVVSHDRGADASGWLPWRAALADYRGRLLAAGRDVEPVAWSLVHMHCNRVAGPDRSAERIAVALAGDLAAAAPGRVPDAAASGTEPESARSAGDGQ